VGGQSPQQKEKKRRKRNGAKTFPKLEKPKDMISTHARARISQNVMLVARRESYHVANAFLTRLKLIWPKSSLKTAKMSKKHGFFAKSSRSQWVKDFPKMYLTFPNSSSEDVFQLT